MLYVVSTPIGNLKDITFRAVEVLKSVDIVAAEDTRHTRKLLAHYDIHTPLTSYFEHNEGAKGERLIKLLKEGKNIALVTDSGTPGISDPGYRIIRSAHDAGLKVTVIPGPVALIAALTLSGLPTDRFLFEGFLPVKAGPRRKKLEALKNEKSTVVFYESPHRLLKSLKDIEEVLGNPRITCVREITKVYEEVKKGTARALADHFQKNKPLGEIVLLWRGEKSGLGE